MIQVDPQTRSAILGLVTIILGAGWVAFGLLGNGDKVFLTIMLVLTILLGSGAAFFLRSRTSK